MNMQTLGNALKALNTVVRTLTGDMKLQNYPGNKREAVDNAISAMQNGTKDEQAAATLILEARDNKSPEFRGELEEVTKVGTKEMATVTAVTLITGSGSEKKIVIFLTNCGFESATDGAASKADVQVPTNVVASDSEVTLRCALENLAEAVRVETVDVPLHKYEGNKRTAVENALNAMFKGTKAQQACAKLLQETPTITTNVFDGELVKFCMSGKEVAMVAAITLISPELRAEFLTNCGYKQPASHGPDQKSPELVNTSK